MDQGIRQDLESRRQSGTVTKCKGKYCADPEHRIFRETREGKFFQSSKSAARDKDLTWGARGIHSYLESLHQHSKITVKRLIELHGAGRDATRAFLKELREKGYISQKCIRVGGQFEYEITVYGSPDLKPETSENHRGRKSVYGENSADGKPRTAQPQTENRMTVDRIPETRPVKDIDQQGKIEGLKDQPESKIKHEDRDTHTERRVAPAEGGMFENGNGTDSDSLRSSGASLRSDAVCVSPHSDFFEVETEEEAADWIRHAKENPWDSDPFNSEQVEDYVLWCRNHLGENIYNPTGLVKRILQERDPFMYDKIENALMDIEITRQQREAAEEKRLEQQRQQEDLKREREAYRQRTEEALRRQQAEEEARRAEEWERNAPHREAARLAQRRQETLNRFEEAKRLSKHSATSPDLYAGMIRNVLADDAEAKRLFAEWQREEANTRAAGAA